MKRRTSFFSAMAAAAALSVAAAAMTIPGAQAATGALAEPCATIESIFARGSGQVVGAAGEEAEIFTQSLHGRFASPITVNSYELGSEAIDGHQYPAVPAPNLLAPPAMPGTAISAAYAFTYTDSIAEGVAELGAYISARAQSCPDTKFVLAGYSQGAQVTGTAYNQAMSPEVRAKVVYSALFGDPNLSLPEGDGAFPPACTGEGPSSSWRQGVPVCTTAVGSLGARVPYVPAGSANTGLWCNSHDFICGSSKVLVDGAGHGLYGTPALGLQTPIDAATQEMARRIVDIAPPAATFTNTDTLRTAPDAAAPFATFDQDAYSSAAGGTITFAASKSYSPKSTVARYDWDFDANGTVDATSTEPEIQHAYPSVFSGAARVTVVDALGASASALAPVVVGASLQIPTPSAAVNVAAVRDTTTPTTVNITWQPVDASAAMWGVTVNGAFAGIYAASATPSAIVTDVRNDGELTVGITPITAQTLIGATTNTVLTQAVVPTTPPVTTPPATTTSPAPTSSTPSTTPGTSETPGTTSTTTATAGNNSAVNDLASTGANNVAWWLRGGSVALVLGGGALFFTRRRH